MCACRFSDVRSCLWSWSWSCPAAGGQGGRSRGEQSLVCIGTGRQDSLHQWSDFLEWPYRLPAKVWKHLQQHNTADRKSSQVQWVCNLSCQVSLNNEVILYKSIIIRASAEWWNVKLINRNQLLLIIFKLNVTVEEKIKYSSESALNYVYWIVYMIPANLDFTTGAKHNPSVLRR